jgi:5-methyltetrahydropteroyltriglutamate--homocysteine methyltransferase
LPSRDPLLITQTGSLPRPPKLSADLRAERRAGVHRSDEVREAAVTATRDVVAHQIAAGVDIVGDGEQGRVGFQIYIPQRMSGFAGSEDRKPPSELEDFPLFAKVWVQRLGDGEGTVGPPLASEDLHYAGEKEAHEDCATLLDALEAAGRTPDTGFVTAPSPGVVTTTFGNRHYESYESFIRAVAAELRKEYRVVIDSGLTLQIDAPDLAMERTMAFSDQSLSEFQQTIELHVDALNGALEGIPRERVRLHCCWGNHESPHTHDVALADILPIISHARVGALGAAFGNPRHQHEIAAVAQHGLPDHMKLIAGVIDTTTNYVEHPEVVAGRLGAAIAAMGDPDRVIASPDCGFGTFAAYELVAPDVVWAKLRTLRQGADLAVERL